MKQLEAIKKRIAAATSGPWVTDTRDNIYHKNEGHHIAKVDPTGQNVRSEDDAEFIAHSRTDIEKLVQAVEVMSHALDRHVVACKIVNASCLQCESMASVDKLLGETP